jgi:hypothetical protein
MTTSCFPRAAAVSELSLLFLMCGEAFVERTIDKYVGSKGEIFYGGAHHHDAGEGEEDHAVAKPGSIVENSDSSANADASTPVDTTKEGAVVTVRAGTVTCRQRKSRSCRAFSPSTSAAISFYRLGARHLLLLAL